MSGHDAPVSLPANHHVLENTTTVNGAAVSTGTQSGSEDSDGSSTSSNSADDALATTETSGHDDVSATGIDLQVKLWDLCCSISLHEYDYGSCLFDVPVLKCVFCTCRLQAHGLRGLPPLCFYSSSFSSGIISSVRRALYSDTLQEAT